MIANDSGVSESNLDDSENNHGESDSVHDASGEYDHIRSENGDCQNNHGAALIVHGDVQNVCAENSVRHGESQNNQGVLHDVLGENQNVLDESVDNQSSVGDNQNGDAGNQLKKSLSFMCFNIEGMWRILDECDFPLLISKYDVAFIVETFTEAIPDKLFLTHNVFSSPGVRVNDNVHGRLSGGVGFLIKKNLCDYVQRIETEFDNFIILKLSKRLLGIATDCLLIGCYIPPENASYYNETDIYNGVSLLEDCVLDVFREHGELPFLVCGDLNSRTASEQAGISDPIDNIHEMTEKTDTHPANDVNTQRSSRDLKKNVFGRFLLRVCEEFDLCILNGIHSCGFSEDFTYTSHNGSSVIDYFIVSRVLLPRCVNVDVVPMIESKHAIVELVLSVSGNGALDDIVSDKPNRVSKFKWTDEKKQDFLDAMNSEFVSDGLSEASRLVDTDVNSALSAFNDCLLFAGECMKTTHSVGTEKLKIWFDLECRQSRKQLRKHLRKSHKSNSDKDRHSYADKRRKYKELLRIKKRLHKENIIDNLKNCSKDPRKFWDILRSVRRKGASSTSAISGQQWFDHFKNVFNPPDADSDMTNADDFVLNAVETNCDALNAPISTNEIRTAIKALKNQKAAGPDGIIGEFFKNSCEQILPFLVNFFNHLFDNGLFPDNWSLSILQPLHKKGDTSMPDNYRGISLLDISSKLYSFVLNRRITDWIEEQNILGEEQAGFREDHSTSDHIFTLLALVQKQLLRHRKLYVAFIDFRKAFDSVNRDKLWKVLNKSGLNGKIVQALQSMYTVVKARVRAGADLTEEFLCPQGVKQGEVCSPVLFSLFINELTKDIIQNGKHGIQLAPEMIELFILLFADDVVLFSDSVIGLQTQLNTLSASAKRLGLVVNLDKSNIVVFRNGGFLNAREKWLFDGQELKIVNMYKYLGIFLSSRLTFSHTFKDLAERASKGVSAIVRLLWSVGDFSPNVFFKLFDCQIQPILTYGSEIWGLSANQECIERVHLSALKRFLGVTARTPRHLVYGETGRYPLYVSTYSRCVKFWLRLAMLDNHRYPRKAYNMLLTLQRQNYDTWACGVRNVLFRFGFGIVWETQGVGNVKAFMFELKQRLIDCFKQDWNSSLSRHNFYYIYSAFKRDVACSDYLFLVKNMTVRKAFTRFRFGMSPLKSHFLEFNPEKQRDKMCPFCPDFEETEVHMLFVCSRYNDLRHRLIPRKFVRQPSLFKLVLLMNGTSDCVIKNLAYFVYKVLAIRHESTP